MKTMSDLFLHLLKDIYYAEKQILKALPKMQKAAETTPLKQAFKTQAAAAFILGVGNVQRDFSALSPPSSPKDSLIYLLLTPKRGGDKVALGLLESPHRQSPRP